MHIVLHQTKVQFTILGCDYQNRELDITNKYDLEGLVL